VLCKASDDEGESEDGGGDDDGGALRWRFVAKEREPLPIDWQRLVLRLEPPSYGKTERHYVHPEVGPQTDTVFDGRFSGFVGLEGRGTFRNNKRRGISLTPKLVTHPF